MKDIKVDSNKVSQNDFPELEGKVVQYNNGGRTYPAVVIGCNRSVGITLVDANDKDKFAICLPGPIMPDHNMFGQKVVEVYDEIVDFTVAGIREGYIDGAGLAAIYTDPYDFGGSCDGAGCAYSR